MGELGISGIGLLVLGLRLGKQKAQSLLIGLDIGLRLHFYTSTDMDWRSSLHGAVA